jgi:(S)-2-hydroxy-acid oxidase
MVDVSKVDTTIHLFGKKYPFPIAFAPSAMQKLAHPQGEECVALAARKLGINMTLSSQSTTSLEDIAELMPMALDGPERWFQLYMSEQPELSIPLIERAAGKPLCCDRCRMSTLISTSCRLLSPRDHR